MRYYILPPYWLPLSAATLGCLLGGCGSPAPQASNNTPISNTVGANTVGANTAGTSTANANTAGTNATRTNSVSSPAASGVSFDQQFIDSMVPHHQSAVMMAQMVVGRAQFPEVRALAKSIIAEQDQEIARMKAWRQAWFGSGTIPPMPGMPNMGSHDDMSGMNHNGMAGMAHSSMSGMDHAKMNPSAMDHAKMNPSKMGASQSDNSPAGMVMTMPGTAMGLPITGRMDMSLIANAKGSAVDHEFLRLMIPHHANAIVMAQEVLIQSKRPQLQKLARGIIAAQAREIGQMEAIAKKRFGAL